MLTRLLREEEGQTLVEYGLLVSLLGLVCIAILTVLGRKLRDVFITVNTNINSGGGTAPPTLPPPPPPRRRNREARRQSRRRFLPRDGSRARGGRGVRGGGSRARSGAR